MLEYRIMKISVKDKEDEINLKLTSLGREGWELVSFQTSSESTGIVKNNEAWTTFYIMIFKRLVT